MPEYATSDGEDAGWLAGQYGMEPDPWQRTVLADWLATRPDGLWVASRRGLALPRQNGKNGVIEEDQLYKMTQLGRKILHTAHEVKTARKAFLRLESYFDNRKYPELSEMVREVRRTNGQEAVVLHNGASCEFVARSRGSGRGFTVDDLYCDEAQELTDEQLAALQPTISAAPSGNSQLTLTGTPPPEALAGQVWDRMRVEAQAGAPGRLCWHEWALDGEPDLDDPEVWAQANPGLGIRLSVETIADERSMMDDETFKRERLGMWAAGGRRPVIPPVWWEAVLDLGSTAGARCAFGVAVDRQHARTTIGVAAERSDGLIHVGIAARQSGTAWVTEWVRERQRRWRPSGWAINPAAPAGALIAPIATRAKVEPILLSGREWAAACGSVYVAVKEQTLRHAGNPELAAAVDGAGKIPLAGAWQWHPAVTDVDITPVQAVTLALAALGHKKARKPKTGRAVAA